MKKGNKAKASQSTKEMKKSPKEMKKNKKSKSGKPSKDLEAKNLDEFLQDWSGNESEASENESPDKEIEESTEKTSSASQQKKYLSSLKDSDPEFHKFLKENDQELLNFDESSDEEEGGDNDELDPIHTIPDNLEVASDDSEYESSEEEDETPKVISLKSKVNKKMIDKWTDALQNQPSVNVISQVTMAFKAALSNISSEEEEKGDSKKGKKVKKQSFKVENGPTFNALIKMIIENLETALKKLLKAKKVGDLTKAKNWKPLNKHLKSYTNDLCKFLGAVSEVSVVSAVLKHIHGMVLYFAGLPKSAKNLSKILIQLWSTHAEESVRVLAFMAIMR